MAPNSFEYDSGFEERDESIYESPPVARPKRLLHVDIILTGIHDTSVHRNIGGLCLNEKHLCPAPEPI